MISKIRGTKSKIEKSLKFSSEKQLHASIHFPNIMLRLTASGKNSPVFCKCISSKAILHIHPFSVLDAESDCYVEELSHEEIFVVGLFICLNRKLDYFWYLTLRVTA